MILFELQVFFSFLSEVINYSYVPNFFDDASAVGTRYFNLNKNVSILSRILIKNLQYLCIIVGTKGFCLSTPESV